MRNGRIKGYDKQGIEVKKMLIVSSMIAIIAIITFIVAYYTYSKRIEENINVGDLGFAVNNISNIQNENTATYETSTTIGKGINEIQEQTNEEKSNDKIAINTSKIEKENNNNNTKETTKEEITQTKIEEKMEFIKPIEGEIIKEFSKDNLVYSETLKEWITHNGIDIKADKKTIVKASYDGTIKSIKNDPRYGITVIIEHSNNFVSIYSNLLTAEFVKEGEKVKQGQTIGTVGNTASFEILDEPHLHFELLKDNEYIDPNEYIK